MGITISSGQTSAVSAGQIQSGDIVLVSGTLNVLSGGTISSTQDMGTVNISAGGAGFGTVLSGPQLAGAKAPAALGGASLRAGPGPHHL
jgi:hypothetical protein